LAMEDCSLRNSEVDPGWALDGNILGGGHGGLLKFLTR
jgi:hypothetical protein